MNDHSPEPWKVRAPYSENRYYITDARDKIICIASTKDAKRIIACVNACQGFTTERLETIMKEGESLLIRFNRLNNKPDVLNIIREENRQLAAEIESLRKQLHRL